MINRPKAPAWSQMENIHTPAFYVCIRRGAALKELSAARFEGADRSAVTLFD